MTILDWITMIKAIGCISENSLRQKWKQSFMILILNKVEIRYKISKWISVSHEGLMSMAIAIHWKSEKIRISEIILSRQWVVEGRTVLWSLREGKQVIGPLSLTWTIYQKWFLDYNAKIGTNSKPSWTENTEIKVLGSWAARIWNFERDRRELKKKRKRKKVRESERKWKKEQVPGMVNMWIT